MYPLPTSFKGSFIRIGQVLIVQTWDLVTTITSPCYKVTTEQV